MDAYSIAIAALRPVLTLVMLSCAHAVADVMRQGCKEPFKWAAAAFPGASKDRESGPTFQYLPVDASITILSLPVESRSRAFPETKHNGGSAMKALSENASTVDSERSRSLQPQTDIGDQQGL